MNPNKATSQISQIRRVTLGGMLINLLLAGIKFIVGYLGSSQAVIADAVHSLSDMVTDITVVFGVRFWSAPPDKSHPYGHQRIEALVTMAIGLAMVSVAVGLGYNALTTIHEDNIKHVGWIAVVGPILSIIFKEILYRWTVQVGVKVKSTALIANAWHHRSDGLSSIPALVAVVVSAMYPNWGFVDRIGSVIIAVFILKVSWDIIAPAFMELSDAGASLDTQEQIRKLTMEVEGVECAHAIRSRKFGSRLHVDLHVLVDPELTVREGHEISENVQNRLIQDGPDVIDAVVHIEPFDEDSRHAD